MVDYQSGDNTLFLNEGRVGSHKVKTKKTKWWIAIALLSGVLLLLFLYFFSRPVPSYAGKDADFWFDSYSLPTWQQMTNRLPGNPVEAFRSMGAAAAPFLTRKLRQSDSWER